MRAFMKDGVIRQTRVSAPLGQPTTMEHNSRDTDNMASKKEDDDFALQYAISLADCDQRRKRNGKGTSRQTCFFRFQ